MSHLASAQSSTTTLSPVREQLLKIATVESKLKESFIFEDWKTIQNLLTKKATLTKQEREILATTWLESDQPQKALQTLNDTQAPAKPQSINLWDAFWTYHRSQLKLNPSNQSSLDAFANCADRVQGNALQALCDYYAFESYRDAKQGEVGIFHLNRLLVDRAGSLMDKVILKEFAEKNILPENMLPPNLLAERGRNLIKRGDTSGAIATFETLNQFNNNQFQEDLALAWFAHRNYPKALELIDSLLMKQTQLLTHDEWLVKKAQALARTSQFSEAISLNKILADNAKDAVIAKEALYKIAFLYFDKGDYAQAIPALKEALRTHPEKKITTLWNLFWCYTFTQNSTEALATLDVLSQTPQVLKDQWMYWQARTLQDAKKNDQAQALYKKIIQQGSVPYYKILAEHRLTHNDPFSFESKSFTISTIKNSEIFPQSPSPAQENYIQPFKGFVTLSAEQAQINPRLIWSIMRQESRFRSNAQSEANAYGLMQLLAKTANQVAESHQFGFDVQPWILDPQINITLSAFYLQELSHQLQNQIPQMIASYNAGPEAIQRWNVHPVTSQDQWIELIPYKETREYTKNVLSNMHAYSQMPF